jgi:hypothetical protein
MRKQFGGLYDAVPNSPVPILSEKWKPDELEARIPKFWILIEDVELRD